MGKGRLDLAVWLREYLDSRTLSCVSAHLASFLRKARAGSISSCAHPPPYVIPAQAGTQFVWFSVSAEVVAGALSLDRAGIQYESGTRFGLSRGPGRGLKRHLPNISLHALP